MKELTRRLRVLRAEREVTQRDLAQKAHIPVGRYWDIENGYRMPDQNELARLARVLKVTPEDILPASEPSRVAS